MCLSIKKFTTSLPQLLRTDLFDGSISAGLTPLRDVPYYYESETTFRLAGYENIET